MPKINKKELIDRWLTPEGNKKREIIIIALQKNTSLEKLGFVEKIDARFDLRGIAFEFKTDLEKVYLRHIDFSYANLNQMLILDSFIEDVIFDEIDGTGFSQYNCTFKNCRFVKADLNHAGFGSQGGTYENVLFQKSKFKNAFFFRPIFSDCAFIECRLDGVDFDSSHFINVKFTGKLDDVWFRGENPREEEREKERKVGHGLNPMIVDFSEAVLWDLAVSDHCDLSKVILPKDGDHILVKNWWDILDTLEKIIEKEFADEEERKVAHRFVRVYKVHAETQNMMILNVKNIEYDEKDDLKEKSVEYSKKLVSLIVEINDKLLN